MQDTDLWVAVRNEEEQYSIWPAARQLPSGWESLGQPDSRDACLAFIEKVWTDMRPRSVRQAMERG